jgi:glycosyltransferase involved in cell wall biosynthesis
VSIRTVAVFHNSAAVGSAWCCAEGILTTLAAEGYQVLNCGNPHHTTVPLELLRKVDLIILGAPEWYGNILTARYQAGWQQIEAPKIAWYAESAYRDDRTFDFKRCKDMADIHYYPAIQDAEEFGGTWLPFAADTTIFRPLQIAKKYETAFLGTIYPKRAEYIQQVGFSIDIMPPVHAQHPVESFHRLAQAYNSTKLFVNMPAYSRLLVTKVTEVMACGTMLVQPALDHPSGVLNMEQFVNGKHLVYYDQNRPDELTDILKYYLHHPEERDAIAAAGLDEIRRAHTMKHIVDRMVADANGFLRQGDSDAVSDVVQVSIN